MHTDHVSVLESRALSLASPQPDSVSRPVPCCPPMADPADPAWWILHRLASPQPFPVAGLPASATPMVGDRTWRRCRRSARP